MNDTENNRRAPLGIDSVLLIDGDNDPHLPPDFPLTPDTLVRVFLRTGAEAPRALARRLADVRHCVSVVSPGGGANAADFVMSFHAGILHSTLPLHMPFMMVTHDKSLAVVAQELQRVGRQAEVWTSHPERDVRRKPSARAGQARGGRSSGGRGSRRRGGARAAAPAVSAAPRLAQAPAAASASAVPGRSIADVAAAYAARLNRLKDPPSRLKALLNDIRNRSGNAAVSPEEVLEELKSRHGLIVESTGRVRIQK